MARPVVIRDETIIQAAREIFLERGIQATTAEVALRAGVSEGSVFKRFKSKFELFRAAMGAEARPSWMEGLEARVGAGDVRENMTALALEIIEFFRRIMPIMMMGWSNPGPNGLPHFGDKTPLPIQAVKRLTAYFEAEMRLGRLRHHDPEVLARIFLGSLNSFVFLEVIQREHSDELPLAPEVFVRGLVNLVWTGAAPRP